MKSKRDKTQDPVEQMKPFETSRDLFMEEFGEECGELIQRNFECQKKAVIGTLERIRGGEEICANVAINSILCIGSYACQRSLREFVNCADGDASKIAKPPLYCTRQFYEFNECMSNKAAAMMKKRGMVLTPMNQQNRPLE